MSSIANDDKAALINQVVALAKRRLPAAAFAEAELFLRQHYHWVAAEDLADRSAEMLCRAALSMLAFVRKRRPHQDKLRVYNPTANRHGWSSPNTVLDLVTGDRPFLIDSLGGELNRRGRALKLVVNHTIRVRRDRSGALVELFAPKSAPSDAWSEAVIRLEFARQNDAAALRALAAGLKAVIDDVRRVVEDWQPMLATLDAAIEELERTAPAAAAAEIGEATAFLRWLADNNFTFLGYRNYDLVERRGGARWKAVPDSAYGVLRNREQWAHVEDDAPGRAIPPEVLEDLKGPRPLIITKTNRRATVHRPAKMDSIGVKRYSRTGKLIGAHRFLGLFTSPAYNQSPREIPLLRKKVATTIGRAGFSPVSHDGKALINILETYPRDELFQIDEAALLEAGLAIMRLQERPRLKLLVRRDTFGRFVSCLVFVPRERYDSTLGRKIVAILEEAIGGECNALHTQLSDAPLARLFAVVRTHPDASPVFDRAAVEARLAEAARGWEDNFQEALREAKSEPRAGAFERYRRAFPGAYRERFSPAEAIGDLDFLESVSETGRLAFNLYQSARAPAGGARFKIYVPDAPLALSDVLPMLENMGLRILDEFPYRIDAGGDSRRVWMHDFGVADNAGAVIDVAAIKDDFEEAFAKVCARTVEDDGFNQLVARAGLSWRQVTVLRAYCKYLRQAKIPFSQAYMERTLASNPRLARLLVRLFEARFDPAAQGRRGRRRGGWAPARIEAEIASALNKVASLDEDRIIRRFVNVIDATVRTNFYQHDADGAAKAYLSFKLDSQRVANLPRPRPMVEIFVYSPRMEGIHLRGGKVARGGLRWSDRPEDFRTEVLGLMKAQMVKNAVIVPVGSKGGFVVKRPPAGQDRAALTAEGIECYKILNRGMLDITDNLVAGKVKPPPKVVRYDEDDPYLVVAADKGTASFSDIANGLSEEYGFWLGDAFASGGSEGYDHKRMGITARGAWESVKRHFRELDHDIQSAPFTVVGIGDMSGDVFGNGLLLSRHIKLVGAFNHLHVFVDPDPDPARSYGERERLFALPRSSWSDYDPTLISAGGGVFDRKAKSVPLSPEMRRLLDIDRDRMTPNELISALLRAPVDLLWNGGIGTYVKARAESHGEVGDRANDGLRIDAAELRCRVIGEGGNLGLTQRARIEAARAGIRVNTDAIDNSAGVDCSDHEVNIKILLGDVVSRGAMTRAQRDKLLVKMTDEVAEHCLRDNYLQAQGISVIESLGAERLELQGQMMVMLERAGLLDRAIEFLPDQEELATRAAAKTGLTRPEISVLFAYAKNSLYAQLLESDLPDDRSLQEDLLRYFPKPLPSKYADRIASHRLRREIIATQLANSLVNRASMVFPLMAQAETGRSASDVARAYVIARKVFRLRHLWAGIEALDNKVPTAVQFEMIVATRRLMEHASLWFLANQPAPLDCPGMIERFGPGIHRLTRSLDAVLAEAQLREVREKAGRLQEAGVPKPLAQVIGAAGALAAALDIVAVANQSRKPVTSIAETYFQLGARLGIDWLRRRAQQMRSATHWQRQAVSAIINDLYGQQRALTARVVESTGAGNGAVERWIANNQVIMMRNEDLFGDLQAADGLDLAMLAVANRQMRALITG